MTASATKNPSRHSFMDFQLPIKNATLIGLEGIPEFMTAATLTVAAVCFDKKRAN